MKRMTLLRSMSSVVLVMLALTACGSNNNNSGTNPGGGNPAPSPSFTTVKQGTLTVGSCLDYPPFEDIKKGQQPVGFDISMVDEIAKRLNLQVKWVKANFNTIFNAVSAHKFDMVAGAATITAERKKIVNFSEPYFSALLSLSINKDKTPNITSTDQLKKGDIVGVQKGTTNAIWATKNLAPKGIVIKSFISSPDSFSDLEAGRITGVINDLPASVGIVKNRPSLAVVQPIEAGQHYGFAFAPDTPELTIAVNKAIEAIVADGTYEKIYHRFFQGPVPKEFQPK